MERKRDNLMLFIHTIDKVLSGEKVQTSRLVKPGDTVWGPRLYVSYDLVKNANGRKMYQVGDTYAVQPGRGKASVARIRIESITRQDVRAYTDEDVNREGFYDDNGAQAKLDFLAVWCSMHDKQFALVRDIANWDFDGTWRYMGDKGVLQVADDLVTLYEVHQRPAERYDAWCLRFELVQP